MTEDERVGWHHQLNGHEFGQTLGDSEGQGGLMCCSPWGHKELDTTEQLNNNIKYAITLHLKITFFYFKILLKNTNHHPSLQQVIVLIVTSKVTDHRPPSQI